MVNKLKKSKLKKSAVQIQRELNLPVTPHTIQMQLKKLGLFYGKVKKLQKLSKAQAEES